MRSTSSLHALLDTCHYAGRPLSCCAVQESPVRAIMICAGGDLLVFPEDADGRILPIPAATPAADDADSEWVLPDRPDSGAAQSSDERLVPWAQPAALDSELDPVPNPAPVGPQQYVHGCLPCADSAHDFAVAERKVCLGGPGVFHIY